jgi:hypothetical protein
MNTLEIIIHVDDTRDTTVTDKWNCLREVLMCHPLENHHIGVRNANISDVSILNDTTKHVVSFVRFNDGDVEALRLHLLSGPDEPVTATSLRVSGPHNNFHDRSDSLCGTCV